MSKHDQLLAVVNRLAVHVPDSEAAQAALQAVRGVVASLRQPIPVKSGRACEGCLYLDLRLNMCSLDQCHEDKPKLNPPECKHRVSVFAGEVTSHG